MKSTLTSIKVFFYILPVIALSLFVFTLANIRTPKPKKSSAATPIQYIPTKLYKSYITEGMEENISVPGEIYTAGTIIPTGSLVVVGISAIANGEMTVTDSQGNYYKPIISNRISDNAKVYIYSSTINQPLQNGDKIIVGNSKLSALAFTVMPFTGVSQIVQSDVLSGNSTDISTASMKTDENQVVVTALGINAKSSNVGFAQIDPNVQNCAPVATDQGDDNLNVYLYLCSYVSTNSQTSIVKHSLLNAYPWSTLSATFK